MYLDVARQTNEMAAVLGWLVIAANGASWGLARLQAAAQIRAELLR